MADNKNLYGSQQLTVADKYSYFSNSTPKKAINNLIFSTLFKI